MNAALDALLRTFSEGGLVVPERVLFLGAEPSPVLREWPDVTGWQVMRPQAAAWDREGLARIDEVSGSWPAVMLLPGKSKEAVLIWLAQAIDSVEMGGLIVCCLANTAGGARFQKELRRALGEVETFQKHKCRVFWGRKTAELNEELVAEWRALAGQRVVGDTDFLVEPGIFSTGRVDPGSAFLAEHLPKRIYGKVADLGAGWGYLSREILQRCPGVKQLDLYEADQRALDCARENLAGEERVNYYWHDVAAGVPEGYDAVVMNPPFHSGLATDVSLGRDFLKSANAALKRHGEVYIVANRQLPYEGELDLLGMRWRKEAENETYKLLFAAKR